MVRRKGMDCFSAEEYTMTNWIKNPKKPARKNTQGDAVLRSRGTSGLAGKNLARRPRATTAIQETGHQRPASYFTMIFQTIARLSTPIQLAIHQRRLFTQRAARCRG